MTGTTEPLTPDEETRLLRHLNTMRVRDASDRWLGNDPCLLIYFLLETGAHPSVLADPKKCRLRVEGDYAVWHRPKTRHEVRVPVSPLLREILGHRAFLDGWAPMDRMTIRRAVASIGAEIGMPWLSPRSLRHTFGRNVARAAGNDINQVMRLMRCSMSVALRYVREPMNRELDKKIREGGLNISLPPP